MQSIIFSDGISQASSKYLSVAEKIVRELAVGIKYQVYTCITLVFTKISRRACTVMFAAVAHKLERACTTVAHSLTSNSHITRAH